MKNKPRAVVPPAPLPPTLAEQKSAFTAEGAPPPGQIGGAPAASAAAAPASVRPRRPPR